MNPSNSNAKDRSIKKEAHKDLKDSPKAERLRMLKEQRTKPVTINDLKDIEKEVKSKPPKKKKKK